MEPGLCCPFTEINLKDEHLSPESCFILNSLNLNDKINNTINELINKKKLTSKFINQQHNIFWGKHKLLFNY